jgi:hypothetical protein
VRERCYRDWDYRWHVLGNRGDLAGRRPVFRLVTLGATIVALSGPLAAQEPIDPSTPDCAPKYLNQTATVGQYVFKAYENKANGNACLEVEDAGHEGRVLGRLAGKMARKDTAEVIFRRTQDSYGMYTLGQAANARNNISKIENGTDLTGRGRPDMIVTNWSGGARCCSIHLVFELEPSLRLVARLDDGDGDLAHFVDLDGHRHYYYVGNDWTFAYWDASFIDSLAPAVVLRFVDDRQGGGYHLATDKMGRPVPTQEEWNEAVREASEAFAENDPAGAGIGSALWSNMLNLIYSGHSDLAWKLFDQTWPAEKTGKETFLSGFCSQLKTSPYWPDLAKTIPDPPASCASAKPERP